jgi:FkbM family methyltransferase
MLEQFRPFLRRHPLVHETARRVRRTGRRVRRAVWPRRIELGLPQAPDGDGAGPAAITFRPSGNHSLLRRLAREGVGDYEPETAACFLAALDRAPDGAVLDIGANVGMYSLLASARSGRPVYGFEPTPDLAGLMRDIARVNRLGFHTEQIAIGRENGTAELYLSDQTDMSNSLAKGFRNATRALTVPVERLDGWCEGADVTPGLIKIDTETTEPAVIEGGLATIEKFRPWLFCEILPNRGIEEPVMELMRPLGYTWYHLAGDPPYEPREQIVGDATHQFLMWLFTPAPVDPEFWSRVSAWRASVDRTRSIPTPD